MTAALDGELELEWELRDQELKAFWCAASAAWGVGDAEEKRGVGGILRHCVIESGLDGWRRWMALCVSVEEVEEMLFFCHRDVSCMDYSSHIMCILI